MSEEKDLLLLKKYLRNECSLEEEDLVVQLLKLDRSIILLDKILSSEAEKDWALFNEHHIEAGKFQEWNADMDIKIAMDNVVPHRSATKPFFMRYAALWAALILTGLGICSFEHFTKKEVMVKLMEQNNPNGQRSIIILPDSTVIYLGAGSTIKYPEIFNGDTREISLSGEAFFEVYRNAAKPFIIHTGSIQTKVLGTSFKIEAFKNRPLSVKVVTGKVKVDQLQKDQMYSLAILLPGQAVIWDNGTIKTSNVLVEEVSIWKDAKLVFNNSSMGEIAEELERWYNLKIIFRNPEKLKERMTVTLDANTPVNRVLDVLTSAGHSSYIIKDKIITIQ